MGVSGLCVPFALWECVSIVSKCAPNAQSHSALTAFSSSMKKNEKKGREREKEKGNTLTLSRFSVMNNGMSSPFVWNVTTKSDETECVSERKRLGETKAKEGLGGEAERRQLVSVFESEWYYLCQPHTSAREFGGERD